MAAESVENSGFKDQFRKIFRNMINWMKPDPSDHLLLQIVKTIAKLPVAIVVIAASPVLLIIMLVVFITAF